MLFLETLGLAILLTWHVLGPRKYMCSVLTSSDVWTGSTLLYRDSLPATCFKCTGTNDPHNNLRHTRCTGTHRYIRHRRVLSLWFFILHWAVQTCNFSREERQRWKKEQSTYEFVRCLNPLARDRCMLAFWFLSHLVELFSNFLKFSLCSCTPLAVVWCPTGVPGELPLWNVRLMVMCPLPSPRLSLWQKPALFGGSHYAFPHCAPYRCIVWPKS